MKMVSKIALAGALVVAMNASALIAPAFAKKEKADAGPTISNEVRAAAIDAQNALNASPKDLPKAETAVTALEAAAKTDYERYLGQSRRLILVNAQTAGQPDAQRGAKLAPLFDALIANPATPKEEVAIRLNERANVSYSLKQYPQAVQQFQRARDLGYTDQDLLLNIARSKVEAGDVVGGTADLDAAVKVETAAGRKPPEAWYKYAFSRLYKAGNTDAGDAWTTAWLGQYGTKENWRGAIYTFGFQGPNVVKYSKNRIDLYRLMWATKSQAGQREYFDYADAAIKVGLPNEAKTVIDEGNANGQIPAGNAFGKELLASARTGLAGASSPAAKEKAALAAPRGDLAGQAGDAYFGVRNYAKAVELYRLSETKGAPDPDRNNLHLGMALGLSGDREGGKTALAKVSTEPNRAIARLWLTYLSAPPVA